MSFRIFDKQLCNYIQKLLPDTSSQLVDSSWMTFSPLAFWAALLLDCIWLTYSAITTWNFGASLLDEETLRPAFFKARVACFWAFWKWMLHSEGMVDLNIGFPHSIGPACALYIKKQIINTELACHKHHRVISINKWHFIIVECPHSKHANIGIFTFIRAPPNPPLSSNDLTA